MVGFGLIHFDSVSRATGVLNGLLDSWMKEVVSQIGAFGSS
jgi:hypothetical protein